MFFVLRVQVVVKFTQRLWSCTT